MLHQWLNAGYFEGNTLYPTKAGTPQGGLRQAGGMHDFMPGWHHRSQSETSPIKSDQNYSDTPSIFYPEKGLQYRSVTTLAKLSTDLLHIAWYTDDLQ